MKVVVHFKNGYELPVECKTFQVERDFNNKLAGYCFEGITGNSPRYISLDDVLCIWIEGEAE